MKKKKIEVKEKNRPLMGFTKLGGRSYVDTIDLYNFLCSRDKKLANEFLILAEKHFAVEHMNYISIKKVA